MPPLKLVSQSVALITTCEAICARKGRHPNTRPPTGAPGSHAQGWTRNLHLELGCPGAGGPGAPAIVPFRLPLLAVLDLTHTGHTLYTRYAPIQNTHRTDRTHCTRAQPFLLLGRSSLLLLPDLAHTFRDFSWAEVEGNLMK